MGKNSQLRREKKEKLETEKKTYRQKAEESKIPWLFFWRRFDFWVYALCFVALVAFPFVKKDDLVYGDQAIIHTSKGDIEISFYTDSTPKTVENFSKLTAEGYYNGLTWHRVIKGFMIQGGDPKGDGTGGASIWGGTFADEINPKSLNMTDSDIKTYTDKGYAYNYNLTSHPVQVGSVAMANSGPNTNGSQFFIVTEKDQPHLNGQHTVFAHVTKGLDVAKVISEVKTDSNDKPVDPIYIKSIELK